MAPRYGLNEKTRIANLLKEKFGNNVTRKEIVQLEREGVLSRRPHWILNEKTVRAARGVYDMSKLLDLIDGLRNGTTDDSDQAESSPTTDEVSTPVE
jgi:hypothetical protein